MSDVWEDAFGMSFEQMCEIAESEPDEIFLTGTGQRITNIHDESQCAGRPCVIHNPSNHSMRDLPTHWRPDRGIMERICPCGVGHPDPDDAEWQEEAFDGRRAAFVHGCDGCCSVEARRARDADREKQLADEDLAVVTRRLIGSAE